MPVRGDAFGRALQVVVSRVRSFSRGLRQTDSCESWADSRGGGVLESHLKANAQLPGVWPKRGSQGCEGNIGSAAFA